MQHTVENYTGIVASPSLLACLGEDGHLKGLFWPLKDSFHSHLEFSITGLCADGRVLWLDPERDQFQVSFFPEKSLLCATWNVRESYLRGLKITKMIEAFGNECFETFIFECPSDNQGLIGKSFSLWSLLHWEMTSQGRFQCVRATENGMIEAFSRGMHVTVTGQMFSNDGNVASLFPIAKALQGSYPNLGEAVNALALRWGTLRTIEMGRAYGGLVSRECVLTSPEQHVGLRLVYRFGADVQPVHSLPWEELLQIHEQSWHKRDLPNPTFDAAMRLLTEEKRKHLYETSLHTLKFLQSTTGALVAAPEHDPDFRYCGGYGFVWPRDAAFCALAYARVGLPLEAKQVLAFLGRLELPGQDFFQRYDALGHLAPAWCDLQADQLGLVLYVLGDLLVDHPGEGTGMGALRRGILVLVNIFLSKRCLNIGFDLWEERRGQHFYALMCAHGAFTQALKLLPDLSYEITEARQICADVIWNEFYVPQEKRFIRTHLEQGQADNTVDICLLSCIYPFPSLSMNFEVQENIFSLCEKRLLTEAGVMRYEGDLYMGGHAWVLGTFWLACAAYRLAETKPDVYLEKADQLFFLGCQCANSGGFFSEQVERRGGELKQRWVLPLAWSHAFFLLAHQLYRAARV